MTRTLAVCTDDFGLTLGISQAISERAHYRSVVYAPVPGLAAEWAAQWQAFGDASGAAPQFVDGHQHVHHLPGVLLEAISTLPTVPAMRNTGHLTRPGFGLKRWLIEGTGGWALQRALRQRGIRHIPSLTGAYDFIAPDYGGQMRGWLAAGCFAIPATRRRCPR